MIRIPITLLGSAGGVGQAVLAVLNRSAAEPDDPLYELLQNADIHIIDLREQPLEQLEQRFPSLSGRLVPHRFDLIEEEERFAAHLRDIKPRVVIDVSWADSVRMLTLCSEHGADYVNTALENPEVDEDESLEGYTLLERHLRFERAKPEIRGNRAIIGSGMNPGVVQWMALELMKQRPEILPEACYIVEEDDSFFRDAALADSETVYTTWSPECFLDEAIYNLPMYVRRGIPHMFAHPVYALDFVYRLGDLECRGGLMPHEEVLTLGELFGFETGFLYRVNDHTTALIRSKLDSSDDLWNHPQEVLHPGHAELTGSDRVGVLLVYKDEELYMYNEMSNTEAHSRYGTNATYLQVACGVYSAAATVLLDGLPEGVYSVDELLLRTESRYGTYLQAHMKTFVTGVQPAEDGLLADRMQLVVPLS